jgi:hypothetical protein
MSLAYATRNPTIREDLIFSLLLSTFRDGTGNQREPDGSTRASWREIERCVAELLNAVGGEDKGIFDVVATDPTAPIAYGFSVKSKQLSRTTVDTLDSGGRVYMEIANSPAKFWDEITRVYGLNEAHFGDQRNAESIGNCLIALVESWHQQGKSDFESKNPTLKLDLSQSRYLCVSYSKDEPNERLYQVHAFSLKYPKNLRWQYSSESCLTAFDPSDPSQRLLDWYGLSGGQLKFYPRGDTAVFRSSKFKLRKPNKTFSVMDKARAYFAESFK